MISAWYWLTPVFILLDWLFDLNWRVAGLADPVWRVAYYLGCLSCACLISWRPSATPWVGLAESTINYGLLIVSIWSGIVGAPADLFESQPVEVMTLSRLLNFLLVGAILIASFNRSLHALRESS